MRTIVAFLAVGAVLIGVSTVLVADSPYDPNIAVERSPFAPERPATFDRTTAIAYIGNYERTRLQNDLLASRGYTLDLHDETRIECTTISANRTATDDFRVRLQCNGKIIDTKRLFDSGRFSYTVTYRLTETTQEQLEIRGYPFNGRDELRPRPTTAGFE
jgi:hypothetical protein